MRQQFSFVSRLAYVSSLIQLWCGQLILLLALRLQHNSARLAARLRQGHPAQGLVEYALIVALLVIVCIGALSMLGRAGGRWYVYLLENWPT